MHRYTTALLWMLGGVVLATALALLAPLGWPFELFSHFRVQYAASALLFAVLLAWRGAAVPAVLALAIAGWHLLPGLASLRGAIASAPCKGPALVVATVNLRFSNERREAVRAWLATRPADVLVIQEVTAAWAAELGSLAGYPYRYILPREDPYGIAMVSRWPLESVTRIDLAGDGLPSLSGEIDAGGQRVHLLGLHTHWPLTPALAAARDEALRSAAAVARGSSLPVVLLGDLNLTAHSPAFGRLLSGAGLQDAMSGRGWRPTWLAEFWPLALRIDHVLVSSSLCVERAEVGPPIGSDHRPVIATLRIPPRRAAPTMGGDR